MNDGLVKQIAENKSEKGFSEKLASLIKSYTIVVLIILIPSILLLFIYSEKLTIYILGDISYHKYYLFGLISFPILVFNSISYALLKGFKQIKYIARSEIIIIGINFLFFIPLIYYFGILGGVIHVGFSFITILIANNYFARKKVLSNFNFNIKDIFNAPISIKSIKELFVFAGFGLTSGLALVISEIVTRSIVVTKLGVDQMGIYSPIMAWAGLFTGFILASFNTYLFPRYSEEKSNQKITNIVNDVLRLSTLIFIPLISLAIPLRLVIIPLFYSKDFIEAAQYLPWHFVGLLFYIWMYPLALVLTPKGRIKHYGIFVVLMCFLDIIVVYFSVPIIGLYGWMLKFIISPILFFIIYLAYLYNFIVLRINKKNILLMSYALCIPFVLLLVEKFFTKNIAVNTLFGLLIILFTLFNLSKEEWLFILRKIKVRNN